MKDRHPTVIAECWGRIAARLQTAVPNEKFVARYAPKRCWPPPPATMSSRMLPLVVTEADIA